MHRKAGRMIKKSQKKNSVKQPKVMHEEHNEKAGKLVCVCVCEEGDLASGRWLTGGRAHVHLAYWEQADNYKGVKN